MPRTTKASEYQRGLLEAQTAAEDLIVEDTGDNDAAAEFGDRIRQRLRDQGKVE